EPTRTVDADGRVEVAGHPDRPAPHVGYPHIRDDREELDERRTQPCEHVSFTVVRRMHPRTEVVRRAAPAEDDPIVRGALRIDDESPPVRDGLSAGPPDRREDSGR